MKKIKWIFGFVAIGLIMAAPCYAHWVRTYGGSGVDIAKSVQRTPDGGFIVAGYTDSFGTTGHAWVLKINANGTVAWENTYGGPGGQGAVCIDQTFDQGSADGYIVAGGPGPPDADFGVIRLNLDGTKAWQKIYGGDNDDTAYSIEQTSDGGCVVAGHTESWGTAHCWVLKLTADGTVDWENVYGGPEDMGARSIQETFDLQGIADGYIVANGPSGPSSGKLGILRLNSDGARVWQKHYDGVAGTGHAKSVRQTSDGGYVVAGTTSFGTGNPAFWLLKLNPDGTPDWERGSFAGHVPYSVEQTSDGGYVVAGYTSGAGNEDFWITKLDSVGTHIWQKVYGGSDVDIAYSAQQTADGGYVVVGSTKSFGAGNEDFWVLKLDANGDISGCLDNIVVPYVFIDEDPVAVTDMIWDPIATSADILDIVLPPEETTTVSYGCSTTVPAIDRIGGTKQAGKIIRIIGSNFGDTQGDSVLHVGPLTFDSTSTKIRLWTDTMIRFRLPFKNKPCSWFKDGNGEYRKRKVWVTVGGENSNVKRVRVMKPLACP